VNDERWYDLIDRIETQFEILQNTETALDTGPGKRHVVEFKSPLGRMRIERETRPVVLERKTHYSKRAGTQATEEFVYSDTEFSQRVSLYRFVDGVWQEEDYRGMFRG